MVVIYCLCIMHVKFDPEGFLLRGQTIVGYRPSFIKTNYIKESIWNKSPHLHFSKSLRQISRVFLMESLLISDTCLAITRQHHVARIHLEGRENILVFVFCVQC